MASSFLSRRRRWAIRPSRNWKSFEWKRTKVLVILNEENRPQAIAKALREFDGFTREYAKAMENEGLKKVGTIGSIVFGCLTGEIQGALKEGLTSYREFREPCWKKVSELKCSPGGVVYHFREELQ